MIVASSFGTDLFRAALQGAPPGTVYALIALGFVLTYKTSGVFNMAFGAQAYVSAIVYYKLHTDVGWGIIPAFVVAVIVLAPALGFVLEWLIFRHLRTAPAVAKLVVAVGLSVALPSLVNLFLKFSSSRTPEGIVPKGSSVFYDVLGAYSYSRDELAAMLVAVLAVAALGALFRFSALGLQMRAVVESPRMAELNRVASDRVSAFAWALSSFFAGLAGVLIAPRFNSLGAGDFFNLVVVGIAAASIGRLVSLPRAMIGGLGLGMLIALFNTFVPKWANTWEWLRPIQSNLTPAIPFLVLFGVLLFDRRLRRTRESGDPLAGVAPPPVSTAGGGAQTTKIGRLLTAVGIAVAVAVVLFRGDEVWKFRATQAVVLAIVFLSLTVITGLAGQISLCQGTFASIGAFTTFQLAQQHGWSPLSAAVIGAVISSAVGGLLSLPLRRLNGIWVAIATLAFAFFFDAVMVKITWIGGESSAATKVPRPTLGPWDFADSRSFLVLTLILLAVIAVVVLHISSGTLGQQLQALRGSEVAAQSIGISAAGARTTAFAISGFIAGLGGALIAMHEGNVNYAKNFTPFGAMFWTVLVVTTGAGLVSGALAGAATFALADAVLLKGAIIGWVLRSPDRIPGLLPIPQSWLFIGFGLATVTFARHPEGSIEMMRGQRASRRRKRAERATSKSPTVEVAS